MLVLYMIQLVRGLSLLEVLYSDVIVLPIVNQDGEVLVTQDGSVILAQIQSSGQVVEVVLIDEFGNIVIDEAGNTITVDSFY